MQLNEIVFHNGEELKKEFDKIEIEIEDKHNMMLVNYVVLTGQIEVIGDKVVQMDSEGNVISEVECDKIFCLKIYSDENEIPENFEESEKCYSLINHQLQFLDDFERSTIGFDLMKNTDGKSYFYMKTYKKLSSPKCQRVKVLLCCRMTLMKVNSRQGI